MYIVKEVGSMENFKKDLEKCAHVYEVSKRHLEVFITSIGAFGVYEILNKYGYKVSGANGRGGRIYRNGSKVVVLYFEEG